MNTRERLIEILVGAYCTGRNENKVLDPDLIEDIATALIEQGVVFRDEVKPDKGKIADIMFKKLLSDDEETLAEHFCLDVDEMSRDIADGDILTFGGQDE